jgi:predicted HicB family RNase H-like nuclease
MVMKNLFIRVDSEMHKRVKVAAANRGESIQALSIPHILIPGTAGHI